MRKVLAIDLGGTKLAAAVVDESGAVLTRRKTPVIRDSLAATADQIAAEAGRCVADTGPVQGAGLIVPGIYRARDAAAWAPNLWGDRYVALKAALAERLSVPVWIDSDRAGYVLGEQWLGVARGLSDVVFLAVGTGIGAGILSGGRLIRGAGDIAGAVGWFALQPEFRELYAVCGCWEAEAAGPALARRAGQATAEQAVEAARGGNPAAVAAIEETVRFLAMGIANLVSLLNPEMVVVGGGLMQAGDLFLEPVRRQFPLWAQPYAARQARIELTALGESAGLLGAARLALAGEAGQFT
jgi:glucokinase